MCSGINTLPLLLMLNEKARIVSDHVASVQERTSGMQNNLWGKTRGNPCWEGVSHPDGQEWRTWVEHPIEMWRVGCRCEPGKHIISVGPRAWCFGGSHHCNTIAMSWGWRDAQWLKPLDQTRGPWFDSQLPQPSVIPVPRDWKPSFGLGRILGSPYAGGAYELRQAYTHAHKN